MSRDTALIIRTLDSRLRGYRAKAVVYLTMLVKRFCHEYNIECNIEKIGLQIIESLKIEPDRLKEVTAALNALTEALSLPYLDIAMVIEELEDHYYSSFVDALYFFIRKDVSMRIFERIFKTLLHLKKDVNKKTRRGSFVVQCPVSYSLDDCIYDTLGLRMSYNELVQLGIVLPYFSETLLFVKEYYVVVPAPYADENYFPQRFPITL
jgi:hypothetical protein